MSVTVVQENVCEILGEGPHWDPKTNSLFYVDIVKRQVHKYNAITGENSTREMGGQVSFVVPRASGGYMITIDNSICVLDWEKDHVTKFLEVEQDVVGNKFNDGKCDASGRLWAGTVNWPIAIPDYAGKNMGSLYSVERDGSISKHVSGISISNGLAWSRDNRTMFFIDSFPRSIYAFDFDLDQGKPSNQRTAIQFAEDSLATLGYPDGCCMDVEDKLWVACYGPGKVVRFDPETGKLLQTVNIPAKEITSCCFGGPNFDELYVTSAAQRTGPDTGEKRLDGSLFKVTGLGVRGLPAPDYCG